MANASPLHFCPRPEGWFLFRRTLLLEDGDLFIVRPAPAWLHREYRDAVNSSGLQCPPRLVLLESAGGYGGLFLPGLVALGRQDLELLAREVWNRHVWSLASTFGRIRLPEIRMAVWRFVIAHELGHALQFAYGDTSQGVRREAGADEVAGWISCDLGLDVVLGEVIAETVGCTQRYCTHPSPISRARAFRRGYRDCLWTLEGRVA